MWGRCLSCVSFCEYRTCGGWISGRACVDGEGESGDGACGGIVLCVAWLLHARYGGRYRV